MVIKMFTGALLAIGIIAVGHTQDYYLVINNGRVVDPETNFDHVC